MGDHVIEKEINCMLIDQLAMLDRIEQQAKKTGDDEMLQLIDKEREVVNRKLYQSPPLQE